MYFVCEASNCKWNRHDSCGKLDVTICSQIAGCPPVCADFEDATFYDSEDDED